VFGLGYPILNPDKYLLANMLSNFFNSRERQLQIDELTKELKRVQEEYDNLKQKLKGSSRKTVIIIQ
jgi:molecular chaperone GrpE (heat shock protein)